jgi:hypothetical protein
VSDPAADLARRLEASLAAIVALGPAIAATPPLPDDARLGPDEDAWGPREVIAHVAEAVAFWHGEIERVLAAEPDGPVPAFGRGPTDALRVALIARDHALPAQVLVERISREGAAVVARVARLTPAERARVGYHPAWDETSVEAIVEWALVAHLEGHVAQLRGLLPPR